VKLVQVPVEQRRQGFGPGQPRPGRLCDSSGCRGIRWSRGHDDPAARITLGEPDDCRAERLFGPAPELISRTDVHDDDAMRVVMGSEDLKEGLTAFIEKRPPSWKGR